MSEPQKENQQPDEQQFTLLERISTVVHSALESFFSSLAGHVTAHPTWFIAAVLIFSVVMAQGVWFYDEEMSSDKQFTPKGSRAKKEEELVNAVFGYDFRGPSAFLVSVNSEKNVLSRESIEFMFEYKRFVEEEVEAEYDGRVTYDLICARYEASSPCIKAVSILRLWHDSLEEFRNDTDHMVTLNRPGAWREVQATGPDLLYFLGKVTYDDSMNIIAAEATRIDYSLRNERKKVSGVGEEDMQALRFEVAWAETNRERRDKWARDHQVEPYLWSQGETDEVAGDATEKDVSSLVIGYVMMVFYVSFVLFRSRVVHSHAALGLMSVVCVGLSTFSAYGLCWYIGIKFNSVVQVLILVLLGIGVDDTFVIMESWWEHGDIPDLRERMKAALGHAGPAITATSCTDLIAFLAGSSTSFPALQAFCYYAAVGITFDFIFQCTFFVSVAFLDTIRESQNRLEMPLCCITVSEDTGCFKEGIGCLPGGGKKPVVKYLLGEVYPKLLVGSPVGKTVSLICTVLLLTFGIWGCTGVRMNFNYEWFVPDGEDIQDDFHVRDTYFEGLLLPAKIYFFDVDFSSEEVQAMVNRTLQLIEEDGCIVKGTSGSWQESLLTWLRTQRPEMPLNGVNTPTFRMDVSTGLFYINPDLYYPALREFASLNGPSYGVDEITNLQWNDDRTAILAARGSIFIKSDSAEDGEVAVDCMKSLRARGDSIAVPAGGRKPFFFAFYTVFWESYAVMVDEITQNVAIAGACVFVLVTLLLANIFMGFILAFVIACVDTCLIGFMHWLNLDLNAVSIICIVVAIGFSVDYSLHIAHSFLLVKAVDTDFASARSQRASFALWKAGVPVFNGGTSTLIAILPLSMAVSYIFTVFFKMFLLIILLGLFFGFVTLPVLLSLIGPSPYTNAIDLQENPRMNPLDPAFSDTKVAPEVKNATSPDCPDCDS